MPRQARIVLPGYLYHVTQRGNYRQDVFQENKDRAVYLRYMQEYSNAYDVKVFAYCLMPNHVHFIVRPQTTTGLADVFCRTHQRYSLYLHKKTDLRGHLWQERFYSCILFGEHITRAMRYVERNPVRGGIVNKPWEYTWSSAQAHLGKEYKLISLADCREYIDFDSWESFLMQPESECELKAIREATKKGLVFGPEEFVGEIKTKFQRNSNPRGRPRKIVTGTNFNYCDNI